MFEKPFPFGAPVSEKDILERENFLQQVVLRLADGQHLMISGPRRIGKTSIALEAVRRLNEKGFYTAVVDLFSIKDMQEFSLSLLDACLENRTGIKKTTEAIQSGLKKISGNVKLSLKISDLELGLNFSNPGQANADYVLDFAEKLAQKDQKNMLLVFDEFQEMSRIGGDLIFKRLRSHFQLHKNVVYMFLGSKGGIMNTLFGHGEEAFYRFAAILPVPPIPVESWVPYMKKKYEDRGIAGTEKLYEKIVDLSGGHPQDTMVLCSEIYYAAVEAGVHKLSLDIVQYGYHNAILTLASVFNAMIDEINQVPLALRILNQIAQGKSLYSREHNPNENKRAVDFLLKRGIIEKNAHGRYAFVEPMFRDYLAKDSNNE
ncbi:P-loop containing nucleoside triphosphate hydrolase [Acididesulfobacillus acetoxydans]|uniref:ATPase n=2 Tax=Acididesulfobacillus acetoxydans TaxID=1561005 RepID=A0A8S0W1J7_9FIRM|nr:P-loop containing nucleoside triphosphate hydrolase [Acididesulfobacillus acetoxydans]CEJ06796.1 ATPase [Acididesulfobacillus acetoxydans]